MVYYVNSDNNFGNDGDKKNIQDLANALRAKGAGEVQEGGVTPSVLCSWLKTAQAGDTGIAIVSGICLGTIEDYAQEYYGALQRGANIVILAWWNGSTKPDCNENVGGSAWDDNFSTEAMRQHAKEHPTANSFIEWLKTEKNYSGTYVCCSGATSAEEAADWIINGKCGGTGGGTTTVQGGSGVYWPDKTYWGLIRQICGAVDAMFIVANNMAYLISFKDFYEYRNRYEEYIPELPAVNILTNSIEKNWATEGFYNTVIIDYGTAVQTMYGQEVSEEDIEFTDKLGKKITRKPEGGRIQYEYTPLVQQYGMKPFYYEFPDDDEETAKAKADALLAAHVRDSGLDIKLSCIYDKQITSGAWLKVPKRVTKINYQRINPTIEGAKKTRKNPFNEEQEIPRKTPNEISDEMELDYDLLFVQGYTVRWDKNHSLVMDLHLKYAPDTPEDPINATIGTGGAIASTTGQYGNDCFLCGDICPAGNTKIMEHYGGSSGTEKCKSLVNGQYQPEAGNIAPRADQNSSYAKELSGKTPAEAFYLFRSTAIYCYYGDECAQVGECMSQQWDALKNGQIQGYNCGDSMRMLKCFFDCTGATSAGVHIVGHYFNCIQINGTWEIIDGTRGSENNTTGFPDGVGYNFSNEHSTSCNPCAY